MKDWMTLTDRVSGEFTVCTIHSWERSDDLGEGDVGEEWEEREVTRTELPHPQPAVITTRINDQVYRVCMAWSHGQEITYLSLLLYRRLYAHLILECLSVSL